MYYCFFCFCFGATGVLVLRILRMPAGPCDASHKIVTCLLSYHIGYLYTDPYRPINKVYGLIYYLIEGFLAVVPYSFFILPPPVTTLK